MPPTYPPLDLLLPPPGGGMGIGTGDARYLQLAGGVMAGDIAMAGNKVVYDADLDTYHFASADDTLQTFVGGAVRVQSTIGATGFYHGVVVRDDKTLSFGNASYARMLWDAAETNDKWKFGLPAAGQGAIIGPVADNGVDRYGATAVPFGWWVRADDATAANRIGMYHDGTNGRIQTMAGNLGFRLGAGVLHLIETTLASIYTPLSMVANPIRNAQYLELEEITTPGATADHGKVYTKNDNKIYFQDGAGAEHEIAFV